MKRFESFLTTALEEYIEYRRSLGYSDRAMRSLLRGFDRYLATASVSRQRLQPPLFLAFRQHLQSRLRPRTVNGQLSAVRGFFQYLVRTGLIETNPLRALPSLRETAFIPFIFSTEQTEQLLSAVATSMRRRQAHFLKDLSTYLAIVLLARCGLRISEPLRLMHHHYRPEEATVYIEKTKFKKDRLIPIPRAVVRELENYLAARKALFLDDRNPALLAWDNTIPLARRHIYGAFHQALQLLEIDQPRKQIGATVFGAPTPHSLRHSFAVNTLKRITNRGGSAQHALPVLSQYLGHSKYRYTAVYLKVLDAEHRRRLVDFAINRQREL